MTTEELLSVYKGITVFKTVITEYTFPNTNKRDRKKGKDGDVNDRAWKFLHAVKRNGLRADYGRINEYETTILITEVVINELRDNPVHCS